MWIIVKWTHDSIVTLHVIRVCQGDNEKRRNGIEIPALTVFSMWLYTILLQFEKCIGALHSDL